MNEEANKRIVREVYDRFKDGDYSGLLNLCSAEIDWSVPEVENSPYTGPWHGIKSVREYFSLMSEAEEITDFEPREFVAQGEKVIVTGRLTSTVRKTGRHFSTEWVHIFTVRNGKIKSFHEFYDTAAALRAFQKATFA
jgi:ketosteroid isomerase-like protein